MRFISTLVLSVLSTLCFAQIAPSPDTPPGAQAAEAFAFAQAQSMITNQAQLQGLIAAQAALLPSAEAQSMFLAQAASLQAQSAANQENMFATQAASFNTMQFSLAQNQRQIQAAILSMRNQGIESASAMKDAVQVASLDPVKLFRRTAMLHAEAAQASGGSTPTQTTAKPSSPDAAPLRLEPPPMMIRPTFGDPLIVDKPTSLIAIRPCLRQFQSKHPQRDSLCNAVLHHQRMDADKPVREIYRSDYHQLQYSPGSDRSGP